MRFVPFEVMITELEFKNDDLRMQHVAFLDHEVIACKRYDPEYNEEAIRDWKEQVRRVILSRSSTVVLRTACGCEQVKNLTDEGQLRSLLVPVYSRVSAVQILPDKLPTNRTVSAREFKWLSRFHKNGAKLLEEQLG